MSKKHSDSTPKHQDESTPMLRRIRNRLSRLLERERGDTAMRAQALLTAPLTDNRANELMAHWSQQYWTAEAGHRRLMLSEIVLAKEAAGAAAENGRLFFRRLYAHTDSLYPLVQLRADLLRWRKEVPEFQPLEAELQALLASWFDVGMLELRPITWDSPASLLERLIEYEAVHEISSWAELKHRLTGNRHCYAYFHPRMDMIPLIFVEIAFTERMADNVQVLLDPHHNNDELPEDKARWAIFYSISNTQYGLRGISLGNFLLKRVIQALVADYPKLRSFATLSPIPGFMRWLEAQHGDTLAEYINDKEERRLARDDADAGRKWAVRIAKSLTEDKNEAIRRIAMEFATVYLTSLNEQGQPLDPVARFHLGNGARIERLNWAADSSERGMRQSCGMMVNYVYELDELDANIDLLAQGKPRSRLSGRWLS